MKLGLKFAFILMLATIMLRWPAKASAAPTTCTPAQYATVEQTCVTQCNGSCGGATGECTTQCQEEYSTYAEVVACINNICIPGNQTCMDTCVPTCVTAACGS